MVTELLTENHAFTVSFEKEVPSEDDIWLNHFLREHKNGQHPSEVKFEDFTLWASVFHLNNLPGSN